VKQNNIKDKTLFTAIFLFSLLLLPSFTAIHHAFTNHTSIVCDSDISTHCHESEFNCEFHDVVLNKHIYISLLSINGPNILYIKEMIPFYLEVNTNEKRPYFSLRAPPVAV
jgi:hypothetical protein